MKNKKFNKEEVKNILVRGPDWVGDFYFHLGDDKYLDRVFEENMVTNFESLFNTALIDTLIYGKDGTRVLSKTPRELIAVG